MKTNYSLADLTKLTGAKRRSVQLWAEAGVIQAKRETERAGTGTHRRFSRREAIIACIVKVFADGRVSIGVLKAIAQAVRTDSTLPAMKGEHPGTIGLSIFEACIAEKTLVFLLVANYSRKLQIARFEYAADADPDAGWINFGKNMTELLRLKTGAGSVIYLNKVLAPLK